MKKTLPFCVALLALVVTGCPRNQYSIELTPHGKVLERKLVFYREEAGDPANTNHGIAYQSFPAEELASITKLYPPGSMTKEGDPYSIHGEFGMAMPNDVGGLGTYTNLTTSLGSAGFYAERFRGNPDLAALAARRSQAADRLADLIIGWSKMELGEELHYKDLQEFLDVDFRRDLKNLSLYWWEGQVTSMYKTNASEEFIVRFGQFLVERGYLKVEEMPALFRDINSNYDQTMMGIVRRLLSQKMGLQESQKGLAPYGFLADSNVMGKSLDKYLAGTERYHTMLLKWEKERKVDSTATKPEPSAVMQEQTDALVEFHIFGGPDDHLNVRLSLAQAPSHTNGKWDEANKWVQWEADLDNRTNAVRLPVFCYASWSQADETFQAEHFGRVVFNGDALSEYCLWRDGLTEKQAGEWEAMLAAVKAGDGLMAKVDAFQFSMEGIQPVSSPAHQPAGPVEFVQKLFKEALEAQGKAAGK